MLLPFVRIFCTKVILVSAKETFDTEEVIEL